jgi:hypothetical protein
MQKKCGGKQGMKRKMRRIKEEETREVLRRG